jgi:hypothetical protein
MTSKHVVNPVEICIYPFKACPSVEMVLVDVQHRERLPMSQCLIETSASASFIGSSAQTGPAD